MIGRSQHTLPALGLGLAEQFTSPGSPLDLHYIELGRQLGEAVQELLGDQVDWAGLLAGAAASALKGTPYGPMVQMYIANFLSSEQGRGIGQSSE